MLGLKFVFLSIYIFFSSYFTGVLFSRILKKEDGFIEKIVYGFIINIALTEFCLWPFVAYRLNTMFFILLSLVLNIVPCFIGIYFSFKEKKKVKVIKWSKKKIILTNILLILVLLQIILTQKYYRSDADDSFYVSNSKLFLESKNLNEYDSSMGNEELGTVPMYDFQIWESLIAVYGYFLNVEPVVVAHTFLVPILLIMCTASMYVLGKTFFKNSENILLFIIFLTIFSLFGGYSTYSFGSRILSRIWQGKTVYHAIVLPAVIAYSMRKLDFAYGVDMFICMIASVGLNPTSLFIIGFEIGFIALSLALYKKNYRYIIYIIPELCIVIFFALIIYLRTSNYPLQMESASSIDYVGIFNILKKFFGGFSWIYIILYACFTYFGYKYGSDEERVSLYIFSLLMLIFVWNPISGKIVAENITKVSTFWRVYWLFPFSYAISASFIHILDKLNNKIVKYTALTFFILLIILPGKWLISKENNFIVATNIYRLPDDVVKIGDYISKENEKGIMLATDEVSTTIRQLYTNVELICSRIQYVLDLIYYRGKQDDAEKRIEMQNIIDGNSEKIDMLEEYLNEYDVKWIVVKKDREEVIKYLNSIEYEIVEIELENNILYKK